MTTEAAERDSFDARLAHSADGPLRDFNDVGMLGAADVHVALRLARLGDDADPDVALAAALAVRAPRLGHVYVDLATIRETATVDAEDPVDLSGLPWPETGAWVERVAASPLTGVGEAGGDASCPLRLVGTRLYLDRYWREERRVAADLAARSHADPPPVDDAVLRDGIGRLFAGSGDSRPALAAACAVLRRFAVVAGGPGTGKTTTVARIVALLDEQAAAAGEPAPLVALAAPTGKAAARLAEAVHEEAARLAIDDATRERLLSLEALTLHRLLGWRPRSHSRFRHDRSNRLPYDVVIVDETSMVSLTLMSRLLDAVRPDARLVLVGDPAQLTSIEAGAVLGDIVGPAANGLLMSPVARSRLEDVTGVDAPPAGPASGEGIGDGIVVLERVHRFAGEIAELARAVRTGDADAALEVLAGASGGVTWIATDVQEPDADAALTPVRELAVAAARRVIELAEGGHAERAVAAVAEFRILCAHRRGAHGAETWMARVEEWLSAAIDGFAARGRWYAGRPLLVTENDYALRLFNGDTGVIVARDQGRMSAAFERQGEVVEFGPTRLGAVDTVYAMTIHKSQGSQFGTAAVLLPPPSSRVLSRELLYTAITRARERLIVVGAEEAMRAAVEHPVARASGLGARLWDGDA